MEVPRIYSKERLQPTGMPAAPVDNPALKALGGLADTVQYEAEQFQKQRAAADALDADRQMRDWWRSQENNYYSRQGKDAWMVSSDADMALREKFTEISGNLSPDAQRTFEKLHFTHRASELDSLKRHELTEDINYRKQTLEGLIVEAKKEITKDPFNLGAAEFIKNRIAAGMMTLLPGPNHAAAMDEIETEILKDQVSLMIEADPERAAPYIEEFKNELGADGYLAAKRQLQTKRRAIKLQIADAEKKEKDAIELARNQEERDLGDLYVAGKYTMALEFVRKSKYLSGDDMKKWYDGVERAIKGDDSDNPFLTSDPKAKAFWTSRVNTEPEVIKSTREIYDRVGVDLSISDAKSLADEWEKRTKQPDPLKDERSKRYHGVLKSMFENEVFGSKDELSSHYTYAEKSDALSAFLKVNPEASDKEIENYLKTLTLDNTNSKVLEFISDFLMAPITFPQKIYSLKDINTSEGDAEGQTVRVKNKKTGEMETLVLKDGKWQTQK
jgi:hypothetical protein